MFIRTSSFKTFIRQSDFAIRYWLDEQPFSAISSPMRVPFPGWVCSSKPADFGHAFRHVDQAVATEELAAAENPFPISAIEIKSTFASVFSPDE